MDNIFWEKIETLSIDEVDNLYILQKIKEIGLPKSTRLRTEILKRLSSKIEGQYQLEYEKVCNYCPEFEETYPIDKILYLIKTTITNMQNYIKDINESSLTEEDKALLFFVLPL